MNEPRIAKLKITKDALVAHLFDGRKISVPLVWSWRLADATPEQLQDFKIIGSGEGVHWPDIDEDISVQDMLQGVPARRPSQDNTKRRPA